MPTYYSFHITSDTQSQCCVQAMRSIYGLRTHYGFCNTSILVNSTSWAATTRHLHQLLINATSAPQCVMPPCLDVYDRMKLSEPEVERLISLLSATHNLDPVLCALLERLSQDESHIEARPDIQDERDFVPAETQRNGMCSIHNLLDTLLDLLCLQQII